MYPWRSYDIAPAFLKTTANLDWILKSILRWFQLLVDKSNCLNISNAPVVPVNVFADAEVVSGRANVQLIVYAFLPSLISFGPLFLPYLPEI